MKRIGFLIMFVLISVFSPAQGVSSLHENFDVDCVLSADFPGGWLDYNATHPVDSGKWTCTPVNGRPSLMSGIATPGILCSGVYGGNYNIDTSFLITPLLNFSSYTGHVYIQFDTKTTRITLGSHLSVIAVLDSGTFTLTAPTVNLDSTISPVIGIGDSSGWETHQVDLTAFKYTPFYVAFRYTSTAGSGSVWYLDNVNTSATRLGIPEAEGSRFSLTALGVARPDEIALLCTATEPGKYYFSVSDLMGRRLYGRWLDIKEGSQQLDIERLGLQPGMYMVSGGNGGVRETVKIVIR